MELNKIYFILFEKFFINYQKLKASITKISVKNSTIMNIKKKMIWLAWERVYFRLKTFLFRKSILWNVIKKEESVFTEQTIENKKNLPSSARRSYWRPVLPLAHHSTAQHNENYNVFLRKLWLKGKLKDSHIHIKEND